MEKENQKVERTNADRERKKKLTNAILMAFVCILMMSGATYAWFTMSNTAKVTSMKLNVAAEGKLYIGTTSAEASGMTTSTAPWSNVTTATTLYPCTTNDGKTMYRPVYTAEDTVSKLTKIEDTDTDKDLYYLQKDFYLYMDDGNAGKVYNVCLVQNDNENGGSYFKSASGTGTPLPDYCVRMSFEVDGFEVAVYEPNYSSNNSGTEGQDYAYNSITDPENYSAFASKHQQTAAGLFETVAADADKALTSGNSDKLFTITGNASPIKVTIRIWFEGTDTDCQNEINLKDIEGQIKFIADKTTTTTTP